MVTLEITVENLKPLTPDEVQARNGTESTGNKKEFLDAARGLMTEEQADKFGALIEESCEQIDE
ncbi:MAG TPA: hypothetical protein VF345_00270 [Chthoniobacterales bacterium]